MQNLFDVDRPAAGELADRSAPAGRIGGRAPEMPQTSSARPETTHQDCAGRTQTASDGAQDADKRGSSQLDQAAGGPVITAVIGPPEPSDQGNDPAGDRRKTMAQYCAIKVRRRRVERIPGTCAVNFLEDDTPRPWPEKIARLAAFLEFGGEALPTAPFHFRPGEFIRDPAKWLATLRADVARGAAGPRARTGALQQDLARLHELFAAPGRTRRAKPR